ncbi:XRE family transcriptional regulator [Pseudonocardia sp.]|uniref:helix-turn-helix domain-containing protein n=1 Tax=Pseudonocardia sp. TaxID=60912 RepID=UPI002637FDB0|nr:XRE family transcriptional regulator [Pseudonocardia sp.]
MTTPATIGERVHILRLANGFSQSDLARSLSNGASEANGLVSKIENGRLTPDDDVLRGLSAALGCTPEYLTSGSIELVATRPWLRAYADASTRVVESMTAGNLVVAESITRLQLERIPDSIPVFDGDLNDDHAIERFAEEVRVAAGIAEGAVVGNAMRAADRLGCVVLPMSSELGRHLGLSQRIGGAPFIRASRPGRDANPVPGDRQRFTVLHEVGHLGLHAALPPPETAEEARRIERQAHRFASAFLAPAEPLIDDWMSKGGRVTLSVLAELKATWGIAIKALVVRFHQLGVISADQATSLYKQISKRGWNRGEGEPVETTNEEPIWLARAITKRAGRGRAAHSALADAARFSLLSERHVRGWIDWTPAGPAADVVDLPARITPGRSGPAGPARVLSFPVTR